MISMCERAHLVGHSMGAWLGIGVAKYHPKRLASLVLGGWDVVNGLPPTSRGPLQFDAFMKFARLTAPHLTRWVTAECEPGVRACFDALAEVDGAGKAVADAGVPVMIWRGRGSNPRMTSERRSPTPTGFGFSRREAIISEWCSPMARRARREYGRLWMMGASEERRPARRSEIRGGVRAPLTICRSLFIDSAKAALLQCNISISQCSNKGVGCAFESYPGEFK